MTHQEMEDLAYLEGMRAAARGTNLDSAEQTFVELYGDAHLETFQDGFAGGK